MTAAKPLKAYEVRDDGEGRCCIAFATNGAAARREGASELQTEWGGVESCVRKPQFDHYAPGPVPPLVLLEHGWWFECGHCGWQISVDGEDEHGGPLDVRPDGKHGLYCSAGCECQDHLARRDKQEAEANLIEVFEARFPGADIGHVHVYRGPRLERGEPGKYCVGFRFPGGKYAVNWAFGDECCMVHPADVEAFKAWRKGVQA